MTDKKIQEEPETLRDRFALGAALAIAVGVNVIWYDTAMSRLDYGRESIVEQIINHFD